ANQAMHPGLSFAIAIGVFSLDEYGDALDPRLLARQDVEDLRVKPLALGPAQVHAQEHLSPILRLGAACPRMNGENGVFLIVLAAEPTSPSLLRAGALEPSQRTSNLPRHRQLLLGLGQIQHQRLLLQSLLQALPAFDRLLQRGTPPHQLLRALGILPQIFT